MNPVGGTPPNVTEVKVLLLSPYNPATKTVVLSSRSKPVTVETLAVKFNMPFVQLTTLTNCADADPQISNNNKALNKKPRPHLIHEWNKRRRPRAAGCDWFESRTIRFEVVSLHDTLGDSVVIMFF